MQTNTGKNKYLYKYLNSLSKVDRKIILRFCALVLCVPVQSVDANNTYPLGCQDPAYHSYLDKRFAHLERTNHRGFKNSLRNYEDSIDAGNEYFTISELARHLIHSAPIDDVDVVNVKIALLLEHIDALPLSKRVAGYVFSGFDDEKHAVFIARAWVAYRQGNNALAFDHLDDALEVSATPVLSAFGPDFGFVRQIYQDGHVEPVLSYLTKSEAIWQNPRADDMRYVWRELIEAQCPLEFGFYDTTEALKLGLSVRDVNR